jgi:thymidylate synthase (FAD)
MAQVVAPRVRLIGWTHFEPPEDVPWSTDAEGGQALAEFAGRACYQSWDKPVPATATNAGFLRHLIEVGHLSVLEHATATFYLTGVSRAFSQQLVRHRHLSYSELSPRQLPGPDAEIVEPDAIAADPALHKTFVEAAEAGLRAYRDLLDGLERTLGSAGSGGKQARQVARAILPGAVETRVVVSGNYRAWRHFVAARAAEHADAEIRHVAVACLRDLQRVAPNAFGDFAISVLADGTEIAASPYAWES